MSNTKVKKKSSLHSLRLIIERPFISQDPTTYGFFFFYLKIRRGVRKDLTKNQTSFVKEKREKKEKKKEKTNKEERRGEKERFTLAHRYPKKKKNKGREKE